MAKAKKATAKKTTKKAAPKKKAAKKTTAKKTTRKAAPKKAAAKRTTAKKATAKKAVKATGPMTKAQIVDHLAAALNTTKKVAAGFLDEFAQLVYKNAKKTFVIPGIGKVYTARTKKRKGRNPAKGTPIIIPAKNKVKFKVSKTLQDAVFPPKK